ncbi:MAG: beta strand repeat-containing protein, partial [Prochlorotrichaceae cyanobacterium]
LNHATSTGGNLTIDPKPITVTGLTASDKAYDGSRVATLTVDAAFTDQIIASDVSGVNVAGTFSSKNVATDQTVAVSLLGDRASNCALTGTLIANITTLDSATWIGPATGGQWFDPNNWASTSNLAAVGALPDGSNVNNVVIPANSTVIFDQATFGAVDPVNLIGFSGGSLILDQGSLTVSGSMSAYDLTLNPNAVLAVGDLSVTGMVNLGTSLTTTNSLAFNNVTLNSDITLTGANINILGAIDGAFGLTLNSAGITTLNGAIGSGTALTTLTTDALGTTYLGTNTTVASNSIIFYDPLVLTTDTTLNGGSSGVQFNNTVDGDGVARNLTVTSDVTGIVSFANAVGASGFINNLSVDAGLISLIPGSSITTTLGNVSLAADDSITLNSGSSITTTDGAIVLNSDRDASDGGAIYLDNANLTTTTGEIVLSGGNSATLNDLKTTGFAWAADTTRKNGVSVLNNSQIISTTGDITLRGRGAAFSGNISNSNYGIQVANSEITSTTGTVNLSGIGG